MKLGLFVMCSILISTRFNFALFRFVNLKSDIYFKLNKGSDKFRKGNIGIPIGLFTFVIERN